MSKTKSELMGTLKAVAFGTALFMVPIGFFLLNYESVCTSEGQVKAIVSVDGRLSTFELEDGRVETRKWMRLKKGDKICLERETRRRQ